MGRSSILMVLNWIVIKCLPDQSMQARLRVHQSEMPNGSENIRSTFLPDLHELEATESQLRCTKFLSAVATSPLILRPKLNSSSILVFPPRNRNQAIVSGSKFLIVEIKTSISQDGILAKALSITFQKEQSSLLVPIWSSLMTPRTSQANIPISQFLDLSVGV